MPAAPPFDDSKIAAIRLLQGAVYRDDGAAWELLLTHEQKLSEFFTSLRLTLVVSEADGFAFIRQMEEEELPEGYEKLPLLMRRTRLGFDATLLAVLLREELRKFDEENLDSEACVIAESELYSAFADFFAEAQDEKRLQNRFKSACSKLDEIGFIKQLTTDPPQLNVRPIIKARLTPERLRETRQQLLDHLKPNKESDDAEIVATDHEADG